MHFEPFRAARDLDRVANQLLSGTRLPLSVPIDVWREGQAYHVELDLPGVDPEGIDLQVERNTLTVVATRQATFEASTGAEKRQVVVAERPQGTFRRELVLGDGLDLDGVQARYTDGVLHLTIPVAAATQPRKIRVNPGGGSPGDSSGSVGEQAADPSI